MAKFDLPTTIDYILEKTGEEKLTYLGHSMGTTMAFAMLSSKPEYNQKIKGLFAMAPVAYIAYPKGVLPLVAHGVPLAVLQLLNHGQLPFNYLMPDWFLDTVCAIPLTSRICVEGAFAVLGDDWPQFNQSRIDLYFRNFPASTSVQVLEHFGQLIASKRFAMFDYNFDNQKFYQQNSSPDYDLSKITVPVVLIWSDNDWLATPKDVETLVSKLKNVKLNHKVDFHGFSHADFIFANDVTPLVYKPLMDAMKLYAP